MSMLPVSKRGVLCYFVAPGDIVVVDVSVCPQVAADD